MAERNPLFSSVSGWFKRTFADPGAVSLFMLLLLGFLAIEFFGQILLPFLISIIVAYILLPLVRLLERWRCPHLLAVALVYLLFIGLLVFGFVGLVPSLLKQLTNLINEIPNAINHSQTWLTALTHRYHQMISPAHLQQVVVFFKSQAAKIGQVVLHYSLATIPGVLQIVVYLILVPLLVFFLLKDSRQILDWFSQYLPRDRSLTLQVWDEVNLKIGAYVKGRVLELLIVGTVSAITFMLFGLQYAVLLGALVGLSVIIPYIGAIVVTIPIVIIALTQWGLSAHFIYLISAYALIIFLDANVLVPYLFSGAMELHPLVILLAVIVFGSLWGFWGVFFAIPLATLIHAVLKAWPKGVAENEYLNDEHGSVGDR